MRRVLVLAALGLATFGAVALASDPGGHVQNAKDLLDQAQAELDAALAEPPQTITETATITTTATVTQTPTTPPPTTPPPTTPPPSGCVGTSVAAGANLATVTGNAPAGTTFCLAAATYMITTNPVMNAGDVLWGAGQDRTVITTAANHGSTLMQYSGVATGLVTFEHLSIGGVYVDPASTTCNGACGAIMLSGNRVFMTDVECFDNGGQCFGGGIHDSVWDNIDCHGNGWHLDALRSDYQSSACLKLNAPGSFVIRNSYIHDNIWSGVWCDFCDHGTFTVVNNRFERNGRDGVVWEVSGDWAPGDAALVRGNTFIDNGWKVNGGSGWFDIAVSSASNIEIDHNSFSDPLARVGATLPDNTLCCQAVRILTSTRNPVPVHDIYIHDNALGNNYIRSCTSSGVTCTSNA